jgi:oxygen-independent coproporphyrinogen III oxidase
MTRAIDEVQSGQGRREAPRGSPYAAYLYSYPHKTAYRPIQPALPLAELWRDERREALSLYIHVPFCSTRCGYCNLFTLAAPAAELVDGYLGALERQVTAVREAVLPARFARFTVGGGTPTVLSLEQLGRLLDLAEGQLGADLHAIPACVEVSPRSAEAAKLALLEARGLDRISIGVQSFVESELRTLGRRHEVADACRALEAIREHRFPTLNIDLIYGIPGQDEASFVESLRAALAFRPQELYLYPLYVRQLTALGGRGAPSPEAWDQQRLTLYRAGRELLLAEGFRQISMRMFRATTAPTDAGPVYRCQEDGMVGLGCGARSYTERLHYSLEYAVRSGEVRAILSGYAARSREAFARADYGIELDDEDRQRRHAILSLLSHEGLDLEAFGERFAAAAPCRALDDQLAALERAGLASRDGHTLRLTPEGVERSDAVGPWLRSARVERRMAEYQPR